MTSLAALARSYASVGAILMSGAVGASAVVVVSGFTGAPVVVLVGSTGAAAVVVVGFTAAAVVVVSGFTAAAAVVVVVHKVWSTTRAATPELGQFRVNPARTNGEKQSGALWTTVMLIVKPMAHMKSRRMLCILKILLCKPFLYNASTASSFLASAACGHEHGCFCFLL